MKRSLVRGDRGNLRKLRDRPPVGECYRARFEKGFLSHNFRDDGTFTVSKPSPLNGALVTVAKLQISEPHVIEMPKRGRSLS
jgi:hypothetical protein